jgi:hypothetical protein
MCYRKVVGPGEITHHVSSPFGFPFNMGWMLCFRGNPSPLYIERMTIEMTLQMTTFDNDLWRPWIQLRCSFPFILHAGFALFNLVPLLEIRRAMLQRSQERLQRL